jgi:hypothetical protein
MVSIKNAKTNTFSKRYITRIAIKMRMAMLLPVFFERQNALIWWFRNVNIIAKGRKFFLCS